MSLENFNQLTDEGPTKAEKMSLFEARLQPYIDLHSLENDDRICIYDLVTLKGGDERVENLFQNISRHGFIADELRKDPNILAMAFSCLSEKMFERSEDAEALIHNIKARQGEIAKDSEERRERVMSNPYATEDEYRLGTFGESLESQAREAVFLLEKKGYNPMESGFNDLALGSQYIGIEKTDGVDSNMIIEALNMVRTPQETGLLKMRISKIHIVNCDDRIQIVLIPKDKKMSLDFWKPILHNIAYLLPDISDKNGRHRNIDNGHQGVTFRETQDNIRQGRNAWLRDGLAFVDGKVVPMSYQDFMKISQIS